MRKILLVLLTFLSIDARTQSKDEQAIRQLLNNQSAAWNRGDIESFMKGYWENDSLMFIGKSGITYGWNKTLDNYKRGYPDTSAMGQLTFTLLNLKKLSAEYFHIAGKWHLQRSIGNLEGYFTLLFRKINGQWMIIADHSS
ncbi:MAG TPA: hypothetical protein VI461_15710 [Chitinophagaceae bacterium]|nr:hypothetical protein [Chitinophagaceae bacterium]